MKRCLLLLLLASIAQFSYSQITLTQLPSGGNKKAIVGERIGLTDVTIRYDRPAVKGREGKIWGNLVPAGFTDQGFGNSTSAPWRAGANEATTIEFSNDVTVEGRPLKRGKYGFFIAYDSAQCTLVFSSNSTQWGSFFYEAKEDVLRVAVKPVRTNNAVEWLKYEFTAQTENAATVLLQWERLVIPFKIETDYVQQQLASFRDELRTDRGFFWLAWDQAAQWCLQRNVNLEQALQWSDSASGPLFGGVNLFGPKSTKAQILQKLGRSEEAAALMKQAMPLASMTELHGYGRNLIALKKPKEAMDVFQMNYQKHPKEFTTVVGMLRGYAANGDYKNALKFAEQALPMATDAQNRNNVETMIGKLKNGQDVN